MAYRDPSSRFPGSTPVSGSKELAELVSTHMDAISRSEDQSLLNTQKWVEAYLELLKKGQETAAKNRKKSAEEDAETDRKLWETKFTNAEKYSTLLGDVFSGLYELTGKHNKSLFLLTKAASLASIAMNTAQGIMAALAPGALGWPMAILIAAEGAVQMALASAQTLAGGGLVQGYSPTKTADNIPLAGTAGEFMQPVDSVDYYGTQVHEAMRQKLIPREIFSGLTLPGAPGPSGGNLQAGGLVGDAGKSEFTFVNLTDPRELDRYLATPAGKDAIINVLSSRSQTVRRLLR